jgi:hypothetical protein
MDRFSMKLTHREFEQLKALQVTKRWDWPATFSTNAKGEIWPYVSHGWTRLEDREEVSGLSSVIDGVARFYLKVRSDGGVSLSTILEPSTSPMKFACRRTYSSFSHLRIRIRSDGGPLKPGFGLSGTPRFPQLCHPDRWETERKNMFRPIRRALALVTPEGRHSHQPASPETPQLHPCAAIGQFRVA